MAWVWLPPACSQSLFAYGSGSTTWVPASSGSTLSWRLICSAEMRSPGSGGFSLPPNQLQPASSATAPSTGTRRTLRARVAMVTGPRSEVIRSPKATLVREPVEHLVGALAEAGIRRFRVGRLLQLLEGRLGLRLVA